MPLRKSPVKPGADDSTETLGLSDSTHTKPFLLSSERQPTQCRADNTVTLTKKSMSIRLGAISRFYQRLIVLQVNAVSYLLIVETEVEVSRRCRLGPAHVLTEHDPLGRHVDVPLSFMAEGCCLIHC